MKRLLTSKKPTIKIPLIYDVNHLILNIKYSSGSIYHGYNLLDNFVVTLLILLSIADLYFQRPYSV